MDVYGCVGHRGVFLSNGVDGYEMAEYGCVWMCMDVY
jgi:hypothetical protein